jgi:hypothetical protein
MPEKEEINTPLLKAAELSPEEFFELYGVSWVVYQQMIKVYQQTTRKKREGRGYTLTSAEQVLCALQYRQNKISQERLALVWGVHRATIVRVIGRVEEAVASFKEFKPQ